MKEKILAALTLATVPAATASHGGSSSLASLQGIVNMLGLTQGDIVHNLGMAATFGLLWLSIYMILKKIIVDVLEAGELFNLQSSGVQNDDKKNLLAVLALLVVLSMLGTGHAMGFIWDLQMLLVGGLVFGVIALLIVVVGGGSAGVAWTAGKTGKALDEGLNEVRDARNRLGNAQDDLNNGNLRDAERNFEDTLEELEDASGKVEKAFDSSDPSQIDSHLDEIIKAHNNNPDPDTEYRKIDQRIENLKKSLEQIHNTASSLPPGASVSVADIMNGEGVFEYPSPPSQMGNRYKNFGLADTKKELEKLIDVADRVIDEEDQNLHTLDDELNTLIQKSKNLSEASEALHKLAKDIEDAEDLEDSIEQAAEQMGDKNLFQRVRRTEDHEQFLENELNNLMSKKRDALKNLKDAKNVIKKDFEINSTEYQEVEAMLETGGDIETLLNDIRSDLSSINNLDPSSNPPVDAVLNSCMSRLNQLRTRLSSLDNKVGDEADDDQKILGAINDAIQELESRDESNLS